MAAPSVTIEGHELATRTGLHCDACGSLSLVEVDIAIVAAESLEVLRRVTGSTCLACGAET